MSNTAPPVQASVTFLHGAADYVAPTAILKVQGPHSRAEYVFGVGEGISRATLEHKARPSKDVRALFMATLADGQMGGLGGLVLRLRADGHRKVRLLACSHPPPR